METTIGGDRLGSGNKQTTSFRNYERSSHDLGYVWRSSMASGTLVPFLCKLGLPGDNWSIDLNCEVLTLPTIGPLFGSYKVQLDVFEIPIRLYNAKLHMNKLGVGMDMSKIMLPQIELKTVNMLVTNPNQTPSTDDNSQINASSLLKYLGISGLGRYTGTVNPVTRQFNAVPFLAYWDIYKNYYSNKQEEIGYYITTDLEGFNLAQTPIQAILFNNVMIPKGNCLHPDRVTLAVGDFLRIVFPLTAVEPKVTDVDIVLDGVDTTLDTAFTAFEWDPATKELNCFEATVGTTTTGLSVRPNPCIPDAQVNYVYNLKSFPLENVDLMREKILQFAGSGPFIISDTEVRPYSEPMQPLTTSAKTYYAMEFSQNCLALKTYQSDLFNNWINTEWIDGAGGISELTAVDTTGDSFTIDALNIASKVYDMLNRIAVSGGTYDDWLEAVYTHERIKGVENPVYCGSLIKELAFEEVVSLAETGTDTPNKAPLGTLAGRGRLTGKHKGGKVNISVNEPSYIIGLVSITPRIDYSQGNEWDVNLKTYDDFHKPALDGIGFQDLVTEQLLWSDSLVDSATGTVTRKSLGKQPAWINYMTSVNKTFGSFAEKENSMFMTLNRRFEKNNDGTLKDGTTYIDPAKYNNIFAEVALDAQNFWTQIAVDITARRKMSAKVIPNL